MGSLFRLADAFHIEKMVFCGNPVNTTSNRMRRTARATYEKIPHEFWELTEEAVEYYKEQGYTPIALELTSQSIPVGDMGYGDLGKILLVVGNERSGISDKVLELIAIKVHITMYGSNSSMNVSHAAAIALYEITKTLFPYQEK